MTNLYIFFLQSSLAFVLFYLAYWLLLRKETHYNANRFFLLLAVLLSSLMPLFPLQYTVFVETGLNQSNLFTEIGNAFKEIKPYDTEGLKQSFSLGISEALLIAYFTGAAIFLFRLLIQTAVLIKLLIKHKTKSIEGLQVIESEKYGLPFSFFNIVFINPKFHKQDVLPEILAHEKVHIREKHWVDLLIIELLTVIFWFNPIIWFFEHSIKLNHEFLADQGVISSGTHIGKYQALLVNQLMGMQIIGLTNNLNYSINSNRLKMMTKQKTPKIKAIKLVWAMPIVALLLFAFAEPNYQFSQAEKSENPPEIASPQKVTQLAGKIVDENENAISGVSIIVEGTSQGTVSDLEGNFKIGLAKNSNLILSYVGKKTMHFTAKELFLKASDKISIEIKMEETAIELNPKMFNQSHTPLPPTASPDKPGNNPPPPPKLAKTNDVPPPPPPPPPPLKGSEEKKVFMVVEEMPAYPGGFKALGKYIKESQEKLASKETIKGKAKLAFTIDSNGEATNIRILEKDNESAGKGAATILLNMEKWSPGKQRGKAVPVNFVLPFEF